MTPESREWEPIRGGLKYKWYSDVAPPLLVRDKAGSKAAAPQPAPEADAAEA